MPFTPNTAYQPLLERFIPDEIEEEEVGTLDKLQAAFITENTLGAALTRESDLPIGLIDDDYNPWNDLTEAERLDEDFLDEAVLAESPMRLEALRRQVGKERDYRRKLTGVDGVLYSMAAGVLDPVNLIPVGSTAYKTYRTGGSILQNGMVTASVAASSAAVQEAILHSQQLERTFGESALNVTAASLLGMALGSLSAKFSKVDIDRMVAETEELMNMPPPGGASRPGSVGAASALDDIEIKGKGLARAIKATAFDPVSRTLTSRSQAARRTLVELAENPINVEGYTGQAVESLAKVRRDSLLYRGVSEHRSIYKEYRKAGGKLNRKGFNELVAREQRNPGSVDDPHVQRSAQAWQRNVYEPQFRDIIDAKLLPEDVEVTTAKQYLNRVWNKQKVASKLPQFTRTVSDWLQARQPELDALEADDLASQIAGRIMSTPDGMLPYDYKIGQGAGAGGGGRGGLKSPFKSRVFDIEDELVEEFLDNDIELLAGRYLRQTSTDIELVRRYGGDDLSIEETLNLTQQKKDIADEFRDMMQRAATDKERRALQKEMNRALDDIDGILERMRGTYAIPDAENIWHRMMSAARNLNFLRFMGGVTISSFPDAARVVMAEGIGRTFGTLFRPLIRGVKAAKLSAEDVRYWGIGTDAVTGGRLEVISDINDYALGGTAVERGLQSMANSFGNINLMNQWTSLMKVTHAVSMQTRVMDDLAKGKFDARLESLGIMKDDALRIAEQVKKHGARDGNAWIYNAKNWDDQALAMQWYAALKKESDRVIVIPGQERPLFMSREVGKTVMQFKSFMLSATQRVLIAGIQGQDAHAIQGVLAMVTLGAMTYAIKQIEAGRPVSDDPRVWIMEGIDRSGAVGILMEINNSVEKVSSNNLGLRGIMGIGATASRYSTRSQTEAMLGPTFGSLLDTTMRVANGLTSEYDWTESDTSAVRRLLPYQNLFVLRTALNEVEKIANEAIE